MTRLKPTAKFILSLCDRKTAKDLGNDKAIEEGVMNEKMKILIAYDGSSCADAALADLRRAGLPRHAEAVVLSVADVWLPPDDETIPWTASEISVGVQKARDRAAQAVEEARALAVQASERIRAHFPDWHVRAEACADSPARGIVKKAEEWAADLIVVGSHGRSALGRFILGSVSHKVVTAAHCSVRVARGRLETTDAPLRIVVGVDGSPDARTAVDAIAARLWPAGSEFRVVAVVDPKKSGAHAALMFELLRRIGESAEDEWVWAHEVAEGLAQLLRAAGLIASARVKAGDPKRMLVQEAEHCRADCIFVGARGLARLERFLLGSVSAAVAAQAHCSVEVVRPRPTA
jgi:nucleotide-binding universal stress UspA family protein